MVASNRLLGTVSCAVLLTACDLPEESDGEGAEETTAASATSEESGESSDAPDAGPDGPELPVEAMARPAQSMTYDGPGFWHQGEPTRYVADAKQYFCFLTAVAGKFAGASDYVRLTRVMHHNPGGGLTGDISWELAGGYATQDAMAGVNCVPLLYYGVNLTYSAEYLWNQYSPPVDLGTSNSRICFLTQMSGNFDSGGDRIEVYTWNGRWWLSGGAASGGVLGGARCVNTPGQAGPFYWSQGMPPQVMKDTNWRCGLTQVRGKFEGWGEYVGVSHEDGYWHLQGTSYQTGVAGAGHCM